MSSSESEQGVRKSEEGHPSERPSARGSTIIVDPGLIAEAERLTESQRPRALSSEHELPEGEAAAQENGELAAAEASERPEEASEQAEGAGDPPEGDAADLDLSVEEAERFASSFRASWEPSMPTSSAASEPAHVPAPAHVPYVAAEPVAARVLVSDLPGANRQRTIMLASAAVAGFLAILLLGWLASRSGAPDHPKLDNPLANTAPIAPAAPKAEVAPKAEAAPPPAPAPSPEPVAAPAGAAQPEVAPAESPAAVAEAAAPPAEPEPMLVALQITTQPSHAQLTLDGSPISNPYDAMHPQGGSHIVEARAPGYQARNLKIELTKKRSVALELQRVRAAEPAPAVAPRAKKVEKRPKPQHAKPAKKAATFVEESPY